MGRILGIDFGIARIGLAISDERHQIALPLKTIPGAKSLKTAVKNLVEALKGFDYTIELIVIGHPIMMSGKPSPMSIQVEEFAKLLKEELSLPIKLWDERLSSAQADRSLKEMQLNRKKRAKQVDVVAASMILQNYLDCQGL